MKLIAAEEASKPRTEDRRATGPVRPDHGRCQSIAERLAELDDATADWRHGRPRGAVEETSVPDQEPAQ